jgi:hypothetical protein
VSGHDRASWTSAIGVNVPVSFSASFSPRA